MRRAPVCTAPQPGSYLPAMNHSHTSPGVVIADYSRRWPRLFEQERDRLADVFADVAVRIEHIGSTSVPGLAAKPIIDILLGAPSLSAIEARIAGVEALGYEYVPEFEVDLPDRRYFRRPRTLPRRYHLHATVTGGHFWRRHICFRDRLRDDPAIAARYEGLKRRLAELHRYDVGAYTDGKTEFIERVIAEGA